MPLEQINNNGYQMFLDTDSVFAPREQGLERQAKQNALARQQSVRNALAQSINPQTGLTNYEFAQQIGGVDLAPELQAARQADALRQEEFLGKQATNRKLGAEANIKENELMISHLQTMGGLIGAAIDQDSYTNNVRQAAAMGYNTSELPENFDAKYVANLRQRALTAEQQLKQQNEAATLAATKARDLATAANQRGTLSVAQRNAAVNEAAERRLGAGAATTDKNLPGKQQLSTIIDKMRGAYETLRTEGAAVQPGGDVLGNIGARLRGTGMAQAVEGAIGTTAQSERTKIKNMRPLLVNAIKQATGMSAQQMNSNVELKLFLDTATNPDTADIDANLAALENLNALYGLGLDVGAPPASAAPTNSGGDGWGKATIKK